MNKIIEKIVNNKEVLIPLLTNLVISFVGSYMAIALFLNSHGMVPPRPRFIIPPPAPIAPIFYNRSPNPIPPNPPMVKPPVVRH